MKEIYLFSGLGADQRAFKALDLSGYKTTFIKWTSPGVNESIEDYAKRLTSQIKSEKPILIGLSFGGMMTLEVAKFIDTEKIILISSAKSRKEIPFYFKLSGTLHLYKLMPSSFLNKPNFIVHWFFGTKTKSERILLNDIIKDTDPVFLKWAIGRIAHWTNSKVQKNLYHIHGTKDRLLPLVHADLVIKGGGHFMILNRAEEITKMVRSLVDGFKA
jgi:pimeloyl-ACP methyl ester carboxylesterase